MVRDATPSRYQVLVVPAAAALLAVVFAIDVRVPLGYAEWALYLLPVGLALLLRSERLPFLLAAAATALIALGWYMQPAGIDRQMGAVNRGIGLVIVWALAATVWQVLAARRRAQRLAWLQQGGAAVALPLLGEQTSQAIGSSAARALCQFLGAQLGVVYRLDGAELLRSGGHAIDESSVPPTLSPHHGLIAEVIRSGQPMATTDIPAGHLAVASALGASEPRHLLIAPLTTGSTVRGVIELGFVRRDADFADALLLLQQVGENIGVAMRSALYRERVDELLAQTQRQSEELQTQQEELRVSNEELEEQSRALRESQARLEEQQEELEQSNAQLEEHTEILQRHKRQLLDTQGVLEANAVQLEAASRYKSEFLANMSHELRTPLNSALILSKLLADNREGTLGAEQVKYAQAIHSSNNDLLELINDILDLSKIEAGHLEVTPEEVPPGTLIDSLRSTFEPLARQKRIAFTTHLDPGLPATITTDRQRLEQVLRNLLSNAIKFTDAGEVSLRVVPQQGERLRFEVRDSGVGIPKHQQQIIFDAFRQADGSTSRRFGGTGLGLTISRELAQRLGGDIEVDSEPGRGSLFAVSLPWVMEARPSPQPSPASGRGSEAEPAAAAAAPAEAMPADDRALRTHGGRLILAVEDDPRFAAVLVDLAHEMNFDCVVAPTAAEALTLARELLPSGVLLDVGLPDASGLSVLEQLKRDPATRHIPVHMLSAHDRQRTALELGAIGYLVKPADREQLKAAIERLQHRLEQSLRRVLVVEDDAALRNNLELLLRGAGTEIVTVATVAGALERLAASSFDCMVMDLALPDGSGYELLEKLAAGEHYSFPPVIVYTGRALTRDDEQRLRRYSKSIIIKGARSPERLLDEVTLFLHSVESSLPADQQRLLRQARRRDSVLDGRRILLAEDDVRNIFALSSVFEPLGAKLEIARNGREAITALERGEIDLVLMDIMMPEMDGLTAMRRIRERPQWAQLPIIALTAKAMPDDRARCLEAGANDYIAKPIDIDKLVSLARVWCPK